MSNNDGVMIGLEIHAQLTALKSKLFCSCSSEYRGSPPNTFTCPTCLGLPGAMPVINKKAIEFATRLALALKCDINKKFYFFRKNYYYPDLPRGFQITMYNKAGGKAFADGGVVPIKIQDKIKEINLNRIHLEEDPGRLVHEGSISKSPYTRVDYNRSGTTLIEIVSEPGMSSPEEAREFLKQLLAIIQYTGICDTNLEGAFRVDANISVEGHERSEVKNINSIKEVESALAYEIKRQKLAIKEGRELIQETRHWDGQQTIGLRNKEFEADYKYFPEQDLVPIEIDQSYIDKIKKSLPEMPKQRIDRYQKDFKLSEFQAEILVLDKYIADFFEKGVSAETTFGPDEYEKYWNWLINDILGWLNKNNMKIIETRLKPIQIVDLVKALKDGTITGKLAKEDNFLNEMMKGTSIIDIIEKLGIEAISDHNTLENICRETLQENPKVIEDSRKNIKAVNKLIGKIMDKTDKQADAKKTSNLLYKILKEEYGIE
jgi:aspartyl-tRNA(Asn)/glutamyl-tRNA(Gln) amidotransferase subunit B